MNRIATNVAGLDMVLGGGLEPGAVVVVAGPPGAGKTILAQQMCFAVATPEHKGVYYTTMSEPHTKLVRHLEPFTFFEPGALGTRVEHIHLGDFLRPPRGDGLAPLVSEIVRMALDEEPAIVVLDSAKMLRDFADGRELRAALFDLTGRLSQTGAVVLLLGEYTSDELASDIEFSLADAIIQLEYQPGEPAGRRWLRVAKMRGGSHQPGEHAFRIGPAGIEIFPRLESLIPAGVPPASGRVRSGIPGLDELMAGGTRTGDATLVMGPSGVGKTIFGLRWTAQELERGNQCLYLTFRDTAAQLTSMAGAFGWDFESACAAGQLVISHVPMGDLDLDALASGVSAELAERPVSRVVVDSLAEVMLAARLPERLPGGLRSLVGLLRAAGASSLLTSETAADGLAAPSLNGLMFLFDNIIDLRYFEQEAQVGRSLSVVRMRTSRHEMTVHSFTITDRGPVVGDRLEGLTGRLGGGALGARATADPARAAVPAPAQASLASVRRAARGRRTCGRTTAASWRRASTGCAPPRGSGPRGHGSDASPGWSASRAER